MTAVPYTIRRSDRARHARILVSPNGVEVVVPRRFALRDVDPLVEEKRPWIERTLRRMRESELELPPARLADGGEVPYLGERLRLRVRVEAGRARPHVTRRGAALHAAVPAAGACAGRWSAGTGAAPAPRSSRRSMRRPAAPASPTPRSPSAASAPAGRAARPPAR